jgi:hypothetical protein
MNAEELIRNTLDGTFTRVLPDNRVITLNVPDNYIPKHNTTGMVIGEKCGQYHQYTPHEDAILVELRGMGFPFHKIGAHLARSEESVKKRYAVLRVMGGASSKSA